MFIKRKKQMATILYQSNTKYNIDFLEHIYKQKNQRFKLSTIRLKQKIKIIFFKFKISITNTIFDTFDLSCRSSFELSKYQEKLNKFGEKRN